ncbi:microfibril-associated glycoprotein 4-like [Physella acuta]|uniref:microfibril-associated glycoprotein 4-like n=1 Tax=Physella acuta TaxID=109671 RepID=UPI0027DDCBA9|nr:microfibril-associated glycoprotein 4-like [Physella acuta]
MKIHGFIVILALFPQAFRCEVKNLEFTLRNKSDLIMLAMDEQHSAEGDLDCAMKCAMSQSDCDSFIYDDNSKDCKLGFCTLPKDVVTTSIPPPPTNSKLFTSTFYLDGNGIMGSCHTAACIAQGKILKTQTRVLYNPAVYKSCADVKNSTNSRQLLQLSSGLVVMCDTVTDGGGWTIFQRRVSGVVDFYRNWEEYKHGFEDFDAGEFYLGNENIYCLTANRSYELRIDMTYQGKSYYASYSSFTLYPESEFYKLSVSGFSGNVVDSLAYTSNQKYTTYDKDNDMATYNCAVFAHGAWWYNSCLRANLNGVYGSNVYGKAIVWFGITGINSSLDTTEMKIRIT